MLATAIVLLALGLPCVALGLHLRRAPVDKAKKKAKQAVGPGPNPTSFIVGGGLLALAGAVLLAVKLAS